MGQPETVNSAALFKNIHRMFSDATTTTTASFVN